MSIAGVPIALPVNEWKNSVAENAEIHKMLSLIKQEILYNKEITQQFIAYYKSVIQNIALLAGDDSLKHKVFTDKQFPVFPIAPKALPSTN